MMSAIAARVPEIASAVLTAAAMTLFAFILTLYLLADGRSTYEWVLAFVPHAHRAKANETIELDASVARMSHPAMIAVLR